MKLLMFLGKTILYVALVFAGMLLSIMSADKSMPRVNEGDLPRDFPVFVTWSEGNQGFCQAFNANEVESLKQLHANASFDVPNPDACIKAIGHFEQNEGKWPVQFEWQSTRRWPYITYSLNHRADGSLDVELSYREDDDDYNKSRYRVRQGSIVEAWQRTGYGPAMAMSQMLSGLGLALLVFVAIRVYRILGKRFGAAAETIKP